MFKPMTIKEISLRPGAEKLGHIQSITLFYDEKKDEIILNSDHKNYDMCSEIVKGYLDANVDKREKIKSKSKSIGYFSQEIKLLDLVIECRMKNSLNLQAKKMLKIVKKQIFFNKVLDEINTFERNDDSHDFYKSYNLFFYGYIQGKRDERARKKQANMVKDGANIQTATLKQIITNRIKGINDLESLQEVYNLLIEKDKRIGA